MKTRKLPLLPGLDGLRAFSVAAVLIYHAQATWLPGGFLGVEFFFVISGFLITAQLLIEWRRTGHISLPRFYQRRARRLLPAVYTLLLAVVVVSLIFFPDEVTEVREAMLASMAYVTNWYLIFNHQSYFESLGRPPLLQHLWSLAVEEQFYLLWPILLSFALRWMRPAFVFPCVVVLASWSVLLMVGLHARGVDTDRLYYGTDTRAAGLLIGAALAFFWRPWDRTDYTGLWWALRVRALDFAGLAAAGALLYIVFHLDETDARLYSGGFAVTSLISAVLIAAVVHPASYVSRAFGLKPLRWIGVRAYSLYLWHWPVFMLTRPHIDVPIDGIPLIAMQLAATLVLADVSYRFVEQPIRGGLIGRVRDRALQLPRRPAWQQGAAVTATAGVIAGLVALSATVATARAPETPDYLQQLTQMSGVISAPPPVAATEVATAAAATAANLAPSAAGAYRGDPTVGGSAAGAPTPQAAPVTATAAAPAATSTPPALAADTSTTNPNASPFQSSVSSSSSSASSSNLPAAPPPAAPIAGGVRATALGDSVMLGAAYELARVLGSVDVDAAVGRQMNTMLGILQSRKDSGQLADVVIIQVGNNGPISKDQFEQMMELLSGAKQVVLLNVHVPLPWQDTNNAIIGDGIRHYKNATLVDWHAFSEGHPELFWSDNVHLRPEGAAAYVSLIASNIR
ncbi:MAG: acetyltransferase [Dehalococcoidia bacterium]|nr:acetyltransferase [Dehalococcoidia bacterium]